MSKYDAKKKSGERTSGAANRPAEVQGKARGLLRWLSSPRNASLVVFLLSVILYANTLGHDFVWDDYELIVENREVRTLDGPTVAKMFTEGLGGADERGGRYYRPLVALSNHVDYRLFGGSPAGFHLTNVLWNAFTCVLVFLLVHGLFRNVGLGLVTAVFFAVCPLHTENVAWISGRTDVVAAFWVLLSLLCYVYGRRRGSSWLIGASLGSFVLALLSKESAACVPALILLLELGPFGSLLSASSGPAGNAAARPGRRGVVGCIVFFAVLAGYALARRAILGAEAAYDPHVPGVLGRVALPLSVLTGYVLKVLYPFSLNAEYDAPVPTTFWDLNVIGGVVIVALLTWSVRRCWRRPDVIMGIGIFVLGLAPAMNIVPIAEISAERFLYFPSLGPALILASLLASALATRPSMSHLMRDVRGHAAWGLSRFAATGVIGVLLVLLAASAGRTVVRNMDWSTQYDLFSKTVGREPRNPRAHASFAEAAYRRGDLRSAIRSYQRALELNPNYSTALSGLAGIYMQTGQFPDALPLVERAVKVVPDNAQLVSNLGSVYFEMGRYAEAAEQLEKALQMAPNEVRAHFNLGLVRLRQTEYPAARTHLLESLEGGPEFNIANYHLAMLEEAAGDTVQARVYARRFLAAHQVDDALRREAAALVGADE